VDSGTDAPAPQLDGDLARLLDGSLHLADFAATVVHEAAQPLTAIQMLVGALREAGDSIGAAERDRLLAGIEGQTQFLRDLAAWLLKPSARATVGVDELVASSAERCRAIAPKHEIVVLANVGKLKMECETARVEATIRNLVGNAARHSPPGGQITIRTERAGEHAVISVSDGGAGIPDTAWESVFEPYVRLDDDTSGYGLGLHLVRSCAIRHGGNARVATSGPSGTTMEFSLRAIT
jgi:signal transduction histidine kinase